MPSTPRWSVIPAMSIRSCLSRLRRRPSPSLAAASRANCAAETPKERAYLAAQLVSGTLNLVQPTSVQGARLVNTGPGLVHRALGHPVRPPCPADMASYITRFGIERTERLIAQIKAVAAGEGA